MESRSVSMTLEMILSMDREEAIKTLIEQKYFGWGAVATFYKKGYY